MEAFSSLLTICAGNSPVPGEFPAQKPVTRSYDVFFDLRLNKRLSKQSWGWWFETLPRPLWRHSNGSCIDITHLCGWNQLTIPWSLTRLICISEGKPRIVQEIGSTFSEIFLSYIVSTHDDVIKWKHFPCYWPFVRGIHRSPVNSPHKGQWRGALMFSLICARINAWVNNSEAGD